MKSLLDWTYYTFGDDGYLHDADGCIDIFGADLKPVKFASAADAEQYLIDSDIRGTVT